jgi:phospholipase/lecithinase/hemolysin
MKSLKRHLAVLLGATALLAACGGGSSQVDPFRPARLISFGDETSALRSDGTKYTINATDATTGAIACGSNPIWVQTLASYYGLVFKQCNTSNLAATTAVMYATAGAKVADVASQVDQQFALDGFNGKDLVTVLAGANDILELYASYGAQSEAVLGDEAEARGKALAKTVNAIANAGGKVIISTMPDIGVTPFAVAERQSHADTDRARLLSELSSRFNLGLRLNVTNDGHKIGLILTDELTQTAAKYPSAYSLSNSTEAACLAAYQPPLCTDKTLTTSASSSNYMWASNTVLGPAIQARIGSLAQSRASNNPF